MNYQDLFEKIRCALGQEGLVVRDKDMVDVWSSENFADFSFHIKGIRGWRFGVWFCDTTVNKEPVSKVTFFAMHEDRIDKFKPSWAEDIFTYETSFSEEDIENENTWWFRYGLIDMAKMIKYHPIISYNIDWHNILDYKSPHIILYLRAKANALKWNIKEWYRDKSKYNLTYLWLKRVKNRLLQLGLYDNIEIVDCNTEDTYSYPRYDLRIYRKSELELGNDSPLATKEWIFSRYTLTGKYMGDRCSLFAYQDDKIIGWWYGNPDDEDFIEAFGWKYKLLKIFKRKDKK